MLMTVVADDRLTNESVHICRRHTFRTTAGRAGRLRAHSRDRCDHSMQVKKPFHRLLLKLVHPDCRLSDRRFNFHGMRVSGEKTALVQIVTSAP
jgi:hypothetical protein